MTEELLIGMTPRHALAEQAAGRRFTPDEMVALAAEWLGIRWYSPSLCELAASGWDEPAVPALWAAAFAELGIVAPATAPPAPVVAPVLAPVLALVPPQGR